MSLFRIVVLAGLASIWAGTVQAGLKFCNETEFTQSVSIGYQGTEDWTSEGWWNVEPGGCATTISADLTARYYYYRAEIDGGDFDGEEYYFCTSPQVYTIVGDAECEGRGFDRERFREIDVGQGVTDFVFTMVADAASDAAPETAEPGLKVCNETQFTQAVSIGYDGAEGWTSEGWWNVEPADCATVVGGELKQRYYYYRAEVDGGDFPAGTVGFCTTSMEYTIVGDTDCEARGYDTEKFAEIDTGASAKGHTVTLVADSETPAAEPEASAGLTICNETDNIQAVSVGYQRGADWISEGWWNIEPQGCSTVLGDALTQQYYYYRAEIDGGDFEGGGYFFCTTLQAYEITGDTECEERGYDREDFAEINVGEGVSAYRLTLDASTGGAATPATDPVTAEVEGLRICNETAQVQAVSIGYQGGEGWTSEGWWNLDQSQCATVLPGELQKRYYYYRAEVDGGPFEGGGFAFCTSTEEYTIVGDTDCEGRGYEREDFAEIDTGPTAKSFTFTILDASSPRADEPDLFEETAPEGVAEPDQPAGADAATEPGGGPGTAADERAPLPPAPEAVPEPEPAPEPEPMPEPEPEPEPEPAPEPMPEIDPMAEPEPEAPAAPRRGGSRG